MTSTRLWDRAAALPVPVDGHRMPEVSALSSGLPSVPELFDFMRDAEARFATLRMRIEERATTARGVERTTLDVVIRHPGHAKVTTSQVRDGAGGDYEVWICDGDLVRTYSGVHKLGTQRPIRNRPRGLADPDLPGFSKVYEPITSLPFETLPDTFVHPAGFCQNVLSTGVTRVVGADRLLGRETVVLHCAHPRTTELPGDRPDHDLTVVVDRGTGVIVRLTETIGGAVTRDAEVVDLGPDQPLPGTAFDFTFPTGTTMLY